MAKRRPVVEYQKTIALRKLDKYEQQLKGRSIGEKDFRRDPQWRFLKAKVDKLKRQFAYVEKRESFQKN